MCSDKFYNDLKRDLASSNDISTRNKYVCRAIENMKWCVEYCKVIVTIRRCKEFGVR